MAEPPSSHKTFSNDSEAWNEAIMKMAAEFEQLTDKHKKESRKHMRGKQHEWETMIDQALSEQSDRLESISEEAKLSVRLEDLEAYS